MKSPIRLNILFPIAVALIFSGCGGGGSSPPPGVQPDPQPLEYRERVDLPSLSESRASYAVAVNDQSVSLVAGLAVNSLGVVKGVTWVADGSSSSPAPIVLNGLAADVALASAAYGVNLGGVAVGEAEDGTRSRAVYWPADSTNPVPLSMMGMLNDGRSAAFDISNDGWVVGEAEKTAGSFVPVLWKGVDAQPTELAASGAAYFIHEGGWIVGEAAGKAVYWTVGADEVVSSAIPLPTLSGHTASVAFGVDSMGRIVGESEGAGGTRAVLWTKNGSGYQVTDLGPSSAQAINDDGLVAGYGGGADPASRAAVWDDPFDHPTRTVQVVGDEDSSQAYGINRAGMVVGTQNHKAFVALPK